MKVVYDWIKEYVGDGMPSVEKFDELFTFHAFEIDGIEKVGNHDIIDVKVLPDRAPDCLSHRGIARELGTLIGKDLAYDPFRESVELLPRTEKIAVTIENPDSCSRFAGALITGVTVAESPDWLKERLQALGQRPINNVVDATNYIMFALGQPLHAYDGEKFLQDGNAWRFGVRMARTGESVVTLSGDTVALDSRVQVIVNHGTDTPVGIAGIKGGKSAEIDTGTTTIILEAANFNPQITRSASQAVKLQTDASKRFENNISPELVSYALRACADLIHEIAGGACEGFTDAYPTHAQQVEVQVAHTHIESLLGITITPETVKNILERLGCTYTAVDGVYRVKPPFERMDITISEDIIAEVGRIYGYAHVPAVMPSAMPLSEYNARYYYSEKIRDILVTEGFSEVITSSFAKKDTVELQNALASDKGCLRSTLRSNMNDALDRNIPNIDLLGIPYVQLFEIGTVFHTSDDGTDVAEHVSLAIGVRMKQQGYTPKDDARLREVLAVLESQLGGSLNAMIEHGVLECNISLYTEKLPAPQSYSPIKKIADVTYQPYSLYPFISRDIALWVSTATTTIDIERLIKEKSGKLLVRLTLFDEFTKEDRVSYAFRLIFQSDERTLTDAEVNGIMDSIYTEMQTRGFEVR